MIAEYIVDNTVLYIMVLLPGKYVSGMRRITGFEQISLNRKR
jgi:hypothetical protein